MPDTPHQGRSDKPVPIVPIRLDNQVVVVSGASRGIGRVMAMGFAAAGAHTVIVARREPELISLATSIRAAGGQVTVQSGDFSQPDVVERVISETADTLGSIDVLVNNLGVAGPTSAVEEISLEDWTHTISVNLTSAFLAIRQAVPVMKRDGGGSIVNIGSVSGKYPLVFRAPYTATKMAMIGMSRTLAAELGPAGIRVNTILPGSVAGERSEEIIAAQAEQRGLTSDQVLAEHRARSPLGTQVAPESILNMALYLASDHAMHMTGQDINVSAGLVMY